jgi:hypothetical protein
MLLVRIWLCASIDLFSDVTVMSYAAHITNNDDAGSGRRCGLLLLQAFQQPTFSDSHTKDAMSHRPLHSCPPGVSDKNKRTHCATASCVAATHLLSLPKVPGQRDGGPSWVGGQALAAATVQQLDSSSPAATPPLLAKTFEHESIQHWPG